MCVRVEREGYKRERKLSMGWMVKREDNLNKNSYENGFMKRVISWYFETKA